MVRLGVSAKGVTVEGKSHRRPGGAARDVEGGGDAVVCASVSSVSWDELQPESETAARGRSSATRANAPCAKRSPCRLFNRPLLAFVQRESTECCPSVPEPGPGSVERGAGSDGANFECCAEVRPLPGRWLGRSVAPLGIRRLIALIAVAPPAMFLLREGGVCRSLRFAGSGERAPSAVAPALSGKPPSGASAALRAAGLGRRGPRTDRGLPQRLLLQGSTGHRPDRPDPPLRPATARLEARRGVRRLRDARQARARSDPAPAPPGGARPPARARPRPRA
jgi:hypothetical protein